MIISKKIILTGSFGVGKSSLFRRFIHSTFDDRYLTTIGVKVDKKTVIIDGRELTMLIWDIAGEVTQDKVPTSYFLGANGIIYVFDLTRATTMQNINADLAYLKTMLPDAAYKTVGNKKDMLSDTQLADFEYNYGFQPDIFTSAKTGENVDELFQLLAADLIKQ